MSIIFFSPSLPSPFLFKKTILVPGCNRPEADTSSQQVGQTYIRAPTSAVSSDIIVSRWSQIC